MFALFFYGKISFMKDFCLKIINSRDICSELESIGFDQSYLEKAANKYRYLNIKIYNLSLPQTNILKQTALSVGADCAVNKGVLTANVEFSDCILGGSVAQIKQIVEKLKYQQFSMSVLSEEIDKQLELSKSEPKIVGVLNLTKNSFSDGGMYYDFNNAISRLNEMIAEGADVIELGAESTKPYSTPVDDEKQLEKLEPVLKYICERNIKTPVSVDTRSSEVAKRVLDYDVSVINDVSGFDYDEKLAEVVSKAGVKVVIQHSQGMPENMQDNPTYTCVVDDIYKNLYKKLKQAKNKGIKQENIILDVGICFGKTKEQNFELIKRIDEFKSLGCKLMLGISRKSFLGLNEASNDEKDIYTVALNTLAIEHKVDYLRVHNVKMHRKLIDIMKNFKEI